MSASETIVYEWEVLLGTWIFLFASALLLFELVRYAYKKALSWRLVGDAVTNFITLTAFLLISYGSLAVAYLAAYYYVYQHWSPIEIPITWWSVTLCVVLADLAYYWEHRFSHRVGIVWATHSVHHSSAFFNISVAYRFGPFDGVYPIIFHIPLVFLGFNPIVVIFSEAVVQLYQTLLHTEAVGKLPRPVEAVMNTPSHHRVHHGSNEQYLDKNYGGIFIVWDRMFGTFVEEKERVVYGVGPPLESINPIVVFLHGFGRLYKKMKNTPGFRSKVSLLIRPP